MLTVFTLTTLGCHCLEKVSPTVASGLSEDSGFSHIVTSVLYSIGQAEKLSDGPYNSTGTTAQACKASVWEQKNREFRATLGKIARLSQNKRLQKLKVRLSVRAPA